MSAYANNQDKVVKVLDKKDTTMLVTRDQQGGLVSRPMTVQQTEADGDLWFFVSNDADVIDEIKADPQINVAYVGDAGYMSLSGTARISDDDDKKQALWYPELKQWFGDVGPESDKVKLIQMSLNTARHWSADQEDNS